jgi:AcrR family transcriptional regulator
LSILRTEPRTKEPQQPRSRRTRSAILQAALELVAEHGFQHVTVADIVARANVSVGSFYNLFADKTALLDTLHADIVNQLAELMAQLTAPDRWGACDVSTMLDRLGLLGSEIVSSRLPVYIAARKYALSDPTAAQREHQLFEGIVRGFAALLLGRKQEIRHPNPATAVDFMARLALAAIVNHFLTPEVEVCLTPIGNQRFVAELVRMAKAYLDVIG